MPFAAFACRLTAWFVLGAGFAGAAFFARYDGLGLAVSGAIGVLSVAIAVGLWALGRVCREVSRLSRHVDPKPVKKVAVKPPRGPVQEPPTGRWRRRAAARSDELTEFFS